MASILIDCFEEDVLDSVIGERAVATTLVDVVTLLGCRADAAAVATFFAMPAAHTFSVDAFVAANLF
jgi:hypothetical protein